MMYTIRDPPEKAKEILLQYANEHKITIGQALLQLLEFGFEYYQLQKKENKKYRNSQDAIKSLPRW